MTGTCESDIERDDLLDTGIVAGPLMATEIGEEVWLPVSPVRGDAFRAVKVEVKERTSVGGYEDKHAIEDWEGDAERLYDRSLRAATDRDRGQVDIVRSTIATLFAAILLGLGYAIILTGAL